LFNHHFQRKSREEGGEFFSEVVGAVVEYHLGPDLLNGARNVYTRSLERVNECVDIQRERRQRTEKKRKRIGGF
jgi:hypothetical protein